MAKLDLTKEKIEVISGKDGIVIRKHLTGIEGGRNLDVTNYTEDVIPAGVVVITNGKGLYKPLVPTVTDGVATISDISKDDAPQLNVFILLHGPPVFPSDQAKRQPHRSLRPASWIIRHRRNGILSGHSPVRRA